MTDSKPWSGACKLTAEMCKVLYGKTSEAKVKTHKLCLIKAFAWNAGTMIKCEDCIYFIGDECAYEGASNEQNRD